MGNRWFVVASITGWVLAALAFVKFIVVKPIVFLGIAIIFAVAAFFAAKGRKWALIMLATGQIGVLAIIVNYIRANGIGPDAAQDWADYMLVVVGLPTTVVGFVASISSLTKVMRAEEPPA